MVVSACIITYNQESYIRECLEGAIIQNVNFDYEIIIGDDCSSDKTSQICEDFAIKYPDLIKYYRRENNLGMCGNWLQTISDCSGKYIALCEGDDYWTDPLKLQKQVDFLEANVKYNYCGHKSSVLNDNKITKIPLEIKTLKFEQLIFKNYLNTATLLFRSSSIQYLPDFFSSVGAADWALQLISIKNSEGAILPYYMSVYREHNEGIWSHLDNKTKCMQGVNLMYAISEIYTSGAERKLIRQAIKKRKIQFNVYKPNKLEIVMKKINKYIKCYF